MLDQTDRQLCSLRLPNGFQWRVHMLSGGQTPLFFQYFCLLFLVNKAAQPVLLTKGNVPEHVVRMKLNDCSPVVRRIAAI